MVATETKQTYKVIGTRPVRPDGTDKVTGRAQYGADIHLTGMLFGRVKRSPHAHAVIKSIDASRALALPGVRAVVTHADFPRAGHGVADIGEGAAHTQYKHGDIEKGFAAADVIIEREFTAPMYHQGYIEPHAATALWNKDGHLTVWNSTQASFPDRATLASTLRTPVSRITVVPME